MANSVEGDTASDVAVNSAPTFIRTCRIVYETVLARFQKIRARFSPAHRERTAASLVAHHYEIVVPRGLNLQEAKRTLGAAIRWNSGVSLQPAPVVEAVGIDRQGVRLRATWSSELKGPDGRFLRDRVILTIENEIDALLCAAVRRRTKRTMRSRFQIRGTSHKSAERGL